MTGTDTATPAVAIVGMAGRFPGARNVHQLWTMLLSGEEAVRRYSDAELRAAGVPEPLIGNPDYLPYGADLPGIEDFDAAFFGINPAEAQVTDPQQRIFLECVWAALEDAGTPPAARHARTGVFASASLSSYLLHHVLPSAQYRRPAHSYPDLPVLIGNDKDFLASRVSYRLGLGGPSVVVQSACSSSLVAVDLACSALRSGTCDIAVAGGVSVHTPQTIGYLRRPDSTLSQDGHCRPFDVAASGMVRGSGCAVVILKRLADALADRDRIHAVIAGIAVNNDGSAKAGYTAPSPLGQADVMRSCLAAARVPASRIGYVEAHGTGTYLGDPIEVAALQLAYGDHADPPRQCALGSIKANIGHLDAAAGIVGLLKAALVLRHQTIPGQINLTEPNPELWLSDTPFVIHTRTHRPTDLIHATAVTSLGIGGTNAHCVLTAPPRAEHRPEPSPGGDYLLLLSAPDQARLHETAADLLAHLLGQPDTRLDDLAYTLAAGRAPQAHRAAVLASTIRQARFALRSISDAADAQHTDDPRVRAWLAGGEPGIDLIGDLSRARKIGLPGTRMRRLRHWIQPETPSPGPVAAADHPSSNGRHLGGGQAAAWAEDPVTTVIEVFRSHLGVERIGPDDDYTALGGDSLLALETVDALRARLATPLTLDRLVTLGTPRRIAQWCQRAQERGVPVPASAPSPRRSTGRSSHPAITTTAQTPHTADADALVRVRDDAGDLDVFLIHPSGGTISFARALAAHSTVPHRMHGIAFPTALTNSLTTIPLMAEHYTGLIRKVRRCGPYRIGGYSVGGLIALEVARMLSERGEQVDPVLLFDTLPVEAATESLSDQEFLARFPHLLSAALGLPSPDQGQHLLPATTVDQAIAAVRQPGWTAATGAELRAMYQVWRLCAQATHRHRPRPYPGSARLFAARQPPAVVGLPPWSTIDPARKLRDLRRLISGDLRLETVPGDHFTMFAAPHVPHLAARYDRALREGAADRQGPRSRPRPAARRGASRPHAQRFPARPARGQGRRRRVAFLFAGQGIPLHEPGQDLIRSFPALVTQADGILGYSVARVCAGDPERPLTDTSYAQPAVYVANALALRRHSQCTGERPIVVLGHSLGQYNALEAAGVFSFADGLRLVAARGAAMARIQGGAMIAVTGIDERRLREALGTPDFARVDLAAANTPNSHTLAGPASELERLTPTLHRWGARSVRRLNVAGPFHSRWMRPAADELRPALRQLRTKPPLIPVIANTTAKALQPKEIIEELIAQMHRPVLWRRSIEAVMAGFDPRFREIGGQRLLAPMVARIRQASSGSAGGH